MTVLEAMHQSLVSPLILADELGIGKTWIDRLLSSMEYIPETGCWVWQKAKTKGYGVVRVRKLSASLFPVHRLCHELAYGPVPADRHVHHRTEEPIRCIGRACGNPEHTLSVAPREHIVELTPGSASNIAAHRDCCAKGHPYTEENTRRDGEGRHCRECEKQYAQAARDKERGTRPKFRWHQEKRRTHCKNGHLVAGDNAYWQQTERGLYASCMICRRRGPNWKNHETPPAT